MGSSKSLLRGFSGETSIRIKYRPFERVGKWRKETAVELRRVSKRPNDASAQFPYSVADNETPPRNRLA